MTTCTDCFQIVRAVSNHAYCPNCSPTIVFEYDPAEPNLFYESDESDIDVQLLTNLVANVAAIDVQMLASLQYNLEAVVKPVEVNTALLRYHRTENEFNAAIDRYQGDLLNTSAVFMLRRARIPITTENKQRMHKMLRVRQYEILGRPRHEVGMKSSLIKAVKAFDKDLFNLSPIWALKIAGERRSFIFEALDSIDLILTTRKMIASQ